MRRSFQQPATAQTRAFCFFFSKKKALLLAFGLCAISIASVGMVAFYQALFRAWPINSDEANWLLASMDFASGNLRLRGWVLAPDNFWGLEIPLIALVWAISHDSAVTLRVVPAVAWTILGVATCAVVLNRERSWGRPAIVAALVLVPVQGVYIFYAESPIHVLSVACIAVAICLVRQAMARPANKMMLILYGIVTIDASASDPLFIVLGALPILAALYLVVCPLNRQRSRIAAMTLAGVALGRGLIWLNTSTGGFTAAPTAFRFVSYDSVPNSLGILARSMLDASGCDFFGMSLPEAGLRLVHLPLFCLAALSIWQSGSAIYAHVKGRWSGNPQTLNNPEFTETGLLLVFVCTVCAMLLSDQVVDITCERFFLPAWMSATAIVALRRGNTLTNSGYCLLISVGTLLADCRIIETPGRSQITSVERELSNTLLERKLTEGFGSYWLASSTTVASGGMVTIRALTTNGIGRLSPFMWLSDRAWYTANFARHQFFVVIRRTDTMLPPQAILNTFGAPDRVLSFNDIVIDVYDKPAPAWPVTVE